MPTPIESFIERLRGVPGTWGPGEMEGVTPQGQMQRALLETIGPNVSAPLKNYLLRKAGQMNIVHQASTLSGDPEADAGYTMLPGNFMADAVKALMSPGGWGAFAGPKVSSVVERIKSDPQGALAGYWGTDPQTLVSLLGSSLSGPMGAFMAKRLNDLLQAYGATQPETEPSGILSWFLNRMQGSNAPVRPQGNLTGQWGNPSWP